MSFASGAGRLRNPSWRSKTVSDGTSKSAVEAGLATAQAAPR
jgi:hypothetical protein